MLILEREDIWQGLDMKKAIDLCEKAYVVQSEGKIFYPPRVWIDSPYKAIMSCALVSDPGFLIHRIFAGHRRWLNVIYLVDYSKQLFVLMDSSIVSALRTGAAAAVSARHLARKDSRTAGIIGASTIAKSALWALCEELPIEAVKVFSLTMEESESYAQEMTEALGVEIAAVPSAKEAAQEADVIVTATTANQSILLSEYVFDGMHICSLGTPEEIDPKLFLKVKIFTEFLEQSRREGKLSRAIAAGVIGKDEVFPDIGEVILGRKTGRTNSREITFFDSQGLTAQDAMLAWETYTQLSSQGRGRLINVDFGGAFPSGIHLSSTARTKARRKQNGMPMERS